MATNERFFKRDTNESETRTEWHRIVAWRKLAEFCEKYLTQGKQIYLEGKLRTRSWQDREGNKRYTTEIEAQNIVLLGRREETEVQEEQSYPEPSTPSEPSEEEKEPVEAGEEDDEVPF